MKRYARYRIQLVGLVNSMYQDWWVPKVQDPVLFQTAVPDREHSLTIWALECLLGKNVIFVGNSVWIKSTVLSLELMAEIIINTEHIAGRGDIVFFFLQGEVK